MRARRRGKQVFGAALAAAATALAACAEPPTRSTAPVTPAASPPPQDAATAATARDASAGGPRQIPPEATTCAATPVVRVTVPKKALSLPPEPTCAGDMFCDWVERAPAGADACFVANDTLRRAEGEMRGAPHRPPGGSSTSAPPPLTPPAPPPVASPAHAAVAPKYLDRVSAHLDLTPDERDALQKGGMVVLDRLPYVDYARAYHDVFQEQLPVFVTVDSILHAVFRATEGALETAERKTLEPALARVLTGLQTSLRASARGLDRQVVNDIDVYLGVAIGRRWRCPRPRSAHRGARATRPRSARSPTLPPPGRPPASRPRRASARAAPASWA